jgi:hypothetical protein
MARNGLPLAVLWMQSRKGLRFQTLQKTPQRVDLVAGVAVADGVVAVNLRH